MQRFWRLLVGLMISGGILAGCQSKQPAADTAKTNIVTTTDFYGSVAKAVGGKHVTVTSIINKPSVDPHDFEPTPAVAKTVSKADIVVANGLGYDGWMNKVVRSTKQAKLIRVGEDVLHRKAGVNEHLWYDAQTMPATANYLAKQLAKQQPQYRAYFKANAKRYIATLKPIQRERAKLQAKAKKMRQRQVLVSEPVFDYALTSLGFKVGNRDFENAVEKGTDPSPQVIHKMQRALKQRQVAFFVNNQQVSDKLVANMVSLAKKNHVPVLSVTETMPAHLTYQQWMLKQYRQLNQLLAD
ncbi:metal ABC transporter solute-binding protein [Lactiplantibacillus paraplantarum]|uniref:Metal ABC transporter substrate-binding protein n=1 Tax=Lactiplantibacillus paraplantarum TaxID=60520 RepID=A0AAD0TP31_9LACO|nr:metal ABC transporter solute-binding protein [Lactiplantibacillus paraplantarum]AVW11245.1 metal ABC transporter substrate-binding protein [Lactiplantibacillus paraplantarum]AYJ39659.1 metal ABC transporter substrate-binding protein [Lactiplantibacillus paraplantarum]ERL45702.1 ABC superfamily ATP binding cassette transporter, binding protein [Lactiplantibacillus paraplantarum]MCU4684728.1 metal ABC transporter solute-binding protein [Lactiplantibacillus paraplantarum]MDL2062080.1 metal ABC